MCIIVHCALICDVALPKADKSPNRERARVVSPASTSAIAAVCTYSGISTEYPRPIEKRFPLAAIFILLFPTPVPAGSILVRPVIYVSLCLLWLETKKLLRIRDARGRCSMLGAWCSAPAQANSILIVAVSSMYCQSVTTVTWTMPLILAAGIPYDLCSDRTIHDPMGKNPACAVACLLQDHIPSSPTPKTHLSPTAVSATPLLGYHMHGTDTRFIVSFTTSQREAD